MRAGTRRNRSVEGELPVVRGGKKLPHELLYWIRAGSPGGGAPSRNRRDVRRLTMEADSTQKKTDIQFGISRLLRETFSPRKDSTANILQGLLEAARLHLGMEVAFISELSEGRRYFRYVDQPEDQELVKVGASDPLDESYCQKVIEGRLPELIHDAQVTPVARDMPVTRKAGIGAHLSTPIRLKDGRIYGTFCSFSFQAEHTLNERDLALMRVFADIAASLIQEDVDRAREEEGKRARIESLLKGDGYSMVWQPIVEIGNARVAGVESLARFPATPHASPADWFDEAREVGLASALETRAIEMGLEALDRLPESVYVAVNVSAEALLQGDIARLLESAPLQRISLEITEHDVIEDYGPLARTLKPLRERGLRLAVDDAGAGYASFRHILQLRPDTIKLDMSLTRDIDSDVTKRSLAASLVQFAREIDAGLVAEGVETKAELDTLERLGVHKVQGFYLHRPMGMEKLVELFEKTR